jgi:L-malate glycosyltransferase
MKKRSLGQEMKPNILLVGNFLSGSGLTPQVCETLCALFRSRGCDVCTTSEKISKPHRLLDIVKTVIFDRKRYDIAIIDTFSGSGFWFAFLAGTSCSLVGKPYILLLHGGNLPDFLDGCAKSPWSSLFQFFSPHPLYRRGQVLPYRSLFRRAWRLISPSPYLAHELNKRGFPVEQIANSIDLSLYKFRLRTAAEPRLFWLRSFDKIYNPILAIKVLALLRRDYPGAVLTMAGPDKGALEACKTFVAEAGLGGAVSFPGFLSKVDINRLAQEHDIFLNTTNVDNTPVSLIEAMALGMPIVTTNVGGIPHLVENGKTALLVPADDEAGMHTAISRLLENSQLSSELSANGRKMAETFSSERVYLQWRALLTTLLEMK